MSNKTNPLENLEGELVDYVSNTPNNINPSVVKSMVRVAADGVSGGGTEAETMWIAAIERGDTQVTKLPNEITSIGDCAFQNCTNLALTSLPDRVTSIGSSAFQNCTNLALTSLPDRVTSIGSSAFQNCTNLVLTSLPEGITSIGSYTFQDCTKLALTSLPAGLKSIGKFAFDSNIGITELTFKGIPTGTISSTAFKSCTNLKTINVPWTEGVIANAPWGATNATINYNYAGG